MKSSNNIFNQTSYNLNQKPRYNCYRWRSYIEATHVTSYLKLYLQLEHEKNVQ